MGHTKSSEFMSLGWIEGLGWIWEQGTTFRDKQKVYGRLILQNKWKKKKRKRKKEEGNNKLRANLIYASKSNRMLPLATH